MRKISKDLQGAPQWIIAMMKKQDLTKMICAPKVMNSVLTSSYLTKVRDNFSKVVFFRSTVIKLDFTGTVLSYLDARRLVDQSRQ